MKKNSITNNLTNSIIEYLQYKGGFARRVNTSGIPVIVNGKIKGWRKSKNKGAADIRCIYYGKSIDIEIKADEKDNLSIDQLIFKSEVEKAGGLFWQIKNFADFENKFKWIEKVK